MHLEELQRQWQRLDEKLDQSLKLESELLRQTVVRHTRRRMNRLAVWPVIDIAFCLAILSLTGSFLGDHWNTWGLVGPAAVVMAGAIMLLIGSIGQLVRVTQIDWCGAVVEMQASLTRLRMAKILQFKWIILLSPLVGFCGLIVGLQCLLDRLPERHLILDKLNPWWVAVNYAFGVLFIPCGYALIRFFANRFSGRGWWQRALDGVSGTSMKQARRELERWANLGREFSNDIA